MLPNAIMLHLNTKSHGIKVVFDNLVVTGVLAEQFGINATSVMIAYAQEKSFYDNAPVNAMQRKRGNMIDVVTIWKPDEITAIHC